MGPGPPRCVEDVGPAKKPDKAAEKKDRRNVFVLKNGPSLEPIQVLELVD
jgi:hypothetical protein